MLHLLTGFETVGIDLNPALVEGFKSSAKLLNIDTAFCQVYRKGTDIIGATSDFTAYLLTAPFNEETQRAVCRRLPAGSRVYSWGDSTEYLCGMSGFARGRSQIMAKYTNNLDVS